MKKIVDTYGADAACKFICKHFERVNKELDIVDKPDDAIIITNELQDKYCKNCPIYMLGVMANVWNGKDLEVVDRDE